LIRTSVRNVASDGIDRASHAAEDNIQHLEAVEEDGVIQDKSSHPSEIPLEDIDQANQSQMHGGNNKVDSYVTSLMLSFNHCCCK